MSKYTPPVAEVRVKGLDQVIARWQRRTGEFPRILDFAVKESAENVRKIAKDRAPRLTGKLREAISKEPGPEEMHWIVHCSDVPYARRRNYENPKNPQTIGYLTKTLFEEKPRCLQNIRTGIRRLKAAL